MGIKPEGEPRDLEQPQENVESDIDNASDDAAEMQAVRDALANVPYDVDDDIKTILAYCQEMATADTGCYPENSTNDIYGFDS